MQTRRILIVDDDTSLRTALFRALDRKGFQVITAASKQEALQLGQSERPADLVLCDLRLPDGDGIDFLTEFRKHSPQSLFIVLTGFGTIEAAVRATKCGAEHFITKPFELDEVTNLVEKTLAHKDLEQENVNLRSALHKKYRFDNIIGQSEGVARVLELIERVSQSDSTVLVTGESGTGKELVAKAIHYNSERANKPFVPINCGAIPGELLESELFGHERGAFTGADSKTSGYFEAANGGTLFIDEVGELEPSIQTKLLRALESGNVMPVGSTREKAVDVRVLAATNTNLAKAVEEKRFRADLFYRLNVVRIELPALRKRPEDIALLTASLVRRLASEHHLPEPTVAPSMIAAMQRYDWPGNVRELRNALESLLVLQQKNVLTEADLPQYIRNPDAQRQNASLDLDHAERDAIERALRQHHNDRTAAAGALRISVRTLYRKMSRYGLT